MKLSKSILLSALFLGLAAAASAAPVSEAVPAQAAPADVFGASVLSASQDCAAADLPETGGLDYNTCGSCSQSICQGEAVDNYCGYADGKVKTCQDYLFTLCPADGGALCRCSSDPIP